MSEKFQFSEVILSVHFCVCGHVYIYTANILNKQSKDMILKLYLKLYFKNITESQY